MDQCAACNSQDALTKRDKAEASVKALQLETVVLSKSLATTEDRLEREQAKSKELKGQVEEVSCSELKLHRCNFEPNERRFRSSAPQPHSDHLDQSAGPASVQPMQAQCNLTPLYCGWAFFTARRALRVRRACYALIESKVTIGCMQSMLYPLPLGPPFTGTSLLL